MARAVKKELGKKKRKKWYNLIATKEFRDAEIGHTLCDEDSNLIGRVVKASLMDLNNDVRGQNVKIKFRVKEIKGEKAFTELLGYELNATNLKRLVKKTKRRLDDSFMSEDREKNNLIIKSVILTRGNAPNSIMTALREKYRKLLGDILKKQSYEQAISNVIGKKIQMGIKSELKKIYPISIVEIRYLEKLS